MRIPSSNRAQKAKRIRELISKHVEELETAMTTLTLNNIKIRPLPTNE
jgi:hypothetical protein